MKQHERATITVPKDLRDKLNEASKNENIPVYKLMEVLFSKYIVNGRVLR